MANRILLEAERKVNSGQELGILQVFPLSAFLRLKVLLVHKCGLEANKRAIQKSPRLLRLLNSKDMPDSILIRVSHSSLSATNLKPLV